MKTSHMKCYVFTVLYNHESLGCDLYFKKKNHVCVYIYICKIQIFIICKYFMSICTICDAITNLEFILQANIQFI